MNWNLLKLIGLRFVKWWLQSWTPNFLSSAIETNINLTLEGRCIIFAIYIKSIHQLLYITARTIVCTYNIYKEAPEDGPLRSETCRAET